MDPIQSNIENQLVISLKNLNKGWVFSFKGITLSPKIKFFYWAFF